MNITDEARVKIRLQLMKKLNTYECSTCHDPLVPEERLIVHKDKLYHDTPKCDPKLAPDIDISEINK